ncbi:MAG: type II secretion system F family protein [Fimbriimonadales bacterium]|nr:type II secretion system F family protein [Fimbriimonadales bacterium]
MPTYSYIALDSSGQRQTGVVEALNERHARQRLTETGLLVETITSGQQFSEDRDVVTKYFLSPLIGRVNREALQRFFAQLNSMYRAGVPLVQSLDTLASSTSHPKLRAVLYDMKEFVLAGRSMSDCMKKYPEVFDGLLTSLVVVGERGGVLDASLQQCADYLEREIKLRNRIKRATFYPKLIFVAILLIPILTAAIIKAIAPPSATILPIFSLSDQPWFWPVVLILLIGGIIFFRLLLEVPQIRRGWDGFLLRVPYIGHTLHMFAMAKFSRAFSALYGGGVPVNEAMAMGADACGNEALRWQIRPAAQKLVEGHRIAQSMAETGAFSSVALDMAATGETTGNMEAMLEHVAKQYEDEADVRMEMTTSVLQIAAIGIAAIVVGFIVVTFFMNYVAMIGEAGAD